ncbi:J domain-containing protein [Neosynechococcus sphagnicola]|uniref:J domain-containing protein n=1 Tax=Neosynechococcus sphagnicola TaxID=1501145 RepID=UPI0009077456|nr:J domain-containing protein [Neosynechococcus sphagnicola]
MADCNHYQTLNISSAANQAEIKQAYRRLAKRFHPDTNRELVSHEQIAQINAAYEVLGDPHRRQFYDQHLQYQVRLGGAAAGSTWGENLSGWQQRTASAQKHYQHHRRSAPNADAQFQRWLYQVYEPVQQLLWQILQPLKQEINLLAADPFDDELMAGFQVYLEDCRHRLSKAQRCFGSMPNPVSAAGVAAYLYYSLNHVGDGLDDLEFFTLNYDDHYLHTGQELFRIAKGLRHDAHDAVKNDPSGLACLAIATNLCAIACQAVSQNRRLTV